MAEKFVLSLESLSFLGFPEILPGCPGPLGVFKKFVQKKFVRIFRPLCNAARRSHPTLDRDKG